MPAIEHRRTTVVDATRLFDLSQDYYRRLDWDPFSKETGLLDGASAPGVGVRTYTVAYNGLRMDAEIVLFERPTRAAMRMTKGPWFLEHFAGTWAFTAQPDGRTEVMFRYMFRTPWPWLRWVIDPILYLVFRRDLRRRLDALVDYGEREIINQ